MMFVGINPNRDAARLKLRMKLQKKETMPSYALQKKE